MAGLADEMKNHGTVTRKRLLEVLGGAGNLERRSACLAAEGGAEGADQAAGDRRLIRLGKARRIW